MARNLNEADEMLGKLNVYRKDKGWSYEELVANMRLFGFDVSVFTVSRWFSNSDRRPNSNNVKRIKSYLGV